MYQKYLDMEQAKEVHQMEKTRLIEEHKTEIEILDRDLKSILALCDHLTSTYQMGTPYDRGVHVCDLCGKEVTP